jgi:hypothetical protein
MAFKPTALKPPGAPLRAKQRNPSIDEQDLELPDALDTPRKELKAEGNPAVYYLKRQKLYA